MNTMWQHIVVLILITFYFSGFLNESVWVAFIGLNAFFGIILSVKE